jgi:L-threonylcarbamoyladenylate synthase
VIVAVAEAARRLERGDVVAYPTETVYGLGADARSAAALERLCALKGRDPTRGMSVLVADAAALERCVPALPARARELARRFWPGPLTLVVPFADPAFAPVATERGVGFRCSPQPTAQALARAARCPVVSTSANRSGEPPARDAVGVVACFGDDLPIAGGEPAGGLSPSTVVAVTADGKLDLLREGALPWSALASEVSP